MRIKNQDKLFNINSILAYGYSYQDTRKEGIPGHNIHCLEILFEIMSRKKYLT